jgi:AraC-like DNA-binding protein
MKSDVVPIPEPLKAYVECIRLTQHDGENGLAINVCLNGLPGIVFQHHEGRSPVENITTRSGRAGDIPTLFVYGQTTQPGVMNHKKTPFVAAQVVLKPHALHSLLGVNAAVLTNSVVDLRELAAGELNMRLMEARHAQECLALMFDFLLARGKQAQTHDRLVEESLRLIQQNIGYITVKHLLECLHLSERQFEKRFSQAVGVPPQFYIRVKRFNEAIRLMKTRRFKKLTEVAYSLNFYDQSHFIHDIKAFSGLTPKSLFQKFADFHPNEKVYAYL